MTKNQKTNPWDPLNDQIDRIRSEYREMPGLRLTFSQMLDCGGLIGGPVE